MANAKSKSTKIHGPVPPAPKASVDGRKPVRQGDVLCIPVKAIPEAARAKKLPEDKDVILAFGEVTGHAHRIKERQLVGFEGDVPGAAAWLEIAAPVSLTHEEHTSHMLPSGAWKINIHREYSPEEIRNVAD